MVFVIVEETVPGVVMANHSLPILFLLCKDPVKVQFFKKHFEGVYYIMEAEECSSFLEWAKITPVSLIFLDFYSLDQPLVNFCIHLRALLGKRKIPIFLISQIIQKSFIGEALKAGVSDFIHEPLDVQEIEERISVHLYSSSTSRKVKTLAKKMKTPGPLPRNIALFRNKTILGNKTLQTILETKETMDPLSLLMVRIDRFEEFEQELGGSGISDLKKQIETLLRSHLRPHDFLVAEGDATYLLLLPKTSSRAGKIIAEDIRSEVLDTNFRIGESEVLCTVSIAVLAFEKDNREADTAFERFALCLERVKHSLSLVQNQGNTVIASKAPL